MNTTVLVGAKELALIEQSGFTAFPPRLPVLPIFYPVTNEGYAIQIARDWNTKLGGKVRLRDAVRGAEEFSRRVRAQDRRRA